MIHAAAGVAALSSRAGVGQVTRRVAVVANGRVGAGVGNVTFLAAFVANGGVGAGVGNVAFLVAVVAGDLICAVASEMSGALAYGTRVGWLERYRNHTGSISRGSTYSGSICQGHGMNGNRARRSRGGRQGSRQEHQIPF